jgi:hypothetical protein
VIFHRSDAHHHPRDPLRVKGLIAKLNPIKPGKKMTICKNIDYILVI